MKKTSNLLIIIPAYNEEESILNTVTEIQRTAPEYDYIIVNDASRDSTAYICRDNNLRYISLPVNLGIGGAVQTGYKYAYKYGYDYAVQIDGDGQHDPLYISQMLEKMISEQADVCVGSRFIEKEGFQSSGLRRLGIRYFSLLIFLLTGTRVTDPTSGLRIVNRDVLSFFSGDYPSDYPEPSSLVSVLKKQKKVIEIPVIMRDRQGGQSSINLKKSIYYMIKVSVAILIERIR